jgi:ABC-type glutathione transport system ATPase component
MSLWFRNLKVQVQVREQESASDGGFFARLASPPREKVLLEDVSGFMLPRKVTAIMGPSGAGKTTLLNCIFGRIERKNGMLLINGQQREMSHYKKVGPHSPPHTMPHRRPSFYPPTPPPPIFFPSCWALCPKTTW